MFSYNEITHFLSFRDVSSTSDHVFWTPSPKGWTKLNVDGSFFSSMAAGDYGGYYHDSEGLWVLGFSTTSNFIDIIMLELEASKHGLEIVWEFGLRNYGVRLIV